MVLDFVFFRRCLVSAWWPAFLLATLVVSQAAGQPPAAKGRADSQAAQSTEIERWIEQLGDDSFTVRKAAADSLLNVGSAARNQLREIAEGPDPELRAAARRIVLLIDASDFRRRLEAFAADVDGTAGLTLPGWERFREWVGGDVKARALFVEMQRQESPVISAAFSERPALADSAWEERILQMVQSQMGAGGQPAAPPLASCSAMLLVGMAPQVEVSDRAALYLHQLVSRPPIQDAMQNGTHREAVRRLVAAWVIHCSNNSEGSLHNRIQIVGANQLSEGLSLPLSVALKEGDYRSAPPGLRTYALVAVGQVGGREQVEKLERLLDDDSVCYKGTATPNRGGPPVEINLQIRDVALMVLLRLTEQRPADYGYPAGMARFEQGINPITLSPPSGEQREAAIKKWRAWRAKEREAKDGKAAKDGQEKKESPAADAGKKD